MNKETANISFNPILSNNRMKKVTMLMDVDQKWYLEEIAHASRMTQKQALYHVIDRYMNEFPLMDKP